MIWKIYRRVGNDELDIGFFQVEDRVSGIFGVKLSFYL